jgi:hypothetical protein
LPEPLNELSTWHNNFIQFFEFIFIEKELKNEISVSSKKIWRNFCLLFLYPVVRECICNRNSPMAHVSALVFDNETKLSLGNIFGHHIHNGDDQPVFFGCPFSGIC